MRLKRLQLQGYKTFASKTEFVFDGGITAIVGPNGSGKSNVADALRWVLGEQSFGALRGKRGTDMIFNGSQSRSRAGMAQATLTLDNSDGWLPIEYAEVEIGRRTYRSGETEYLLNGQKVRLMDIQDLLATSGLAERTYTMIGQGLIDQALSLRPQERRALFEEAAGISHYQVKRAETLRRLEETDHNLQRVQDILAEIRPRLNSLKRQAERTQAYRLVEDELRGHLRRWYGYQWHLALTQLMQQRRAADEAARCWELSRQQLLARQSAIGEQRRLLHRQQDELRRRQAEIERLVERQQAAGREVAVLAERQSLLQRQIDELDQELPQLEHQESLARQALDEAVRDLESALSAVREQELVSERFDSHHELQVSEIAAWQRRESELIEERSLVQKRLAHLRGEIGQLRERQQEKEASLDRAEELAALEALAAKQSANLEDAQRTRKELMEQRASLQAELAEMGRQQKSLRRTRSDRAQALKQLETSIARLETRAEMLDQMRHKEAPADRDVRLIGRLAALITIPPDFRTAIEAALASRLATLIVPDERALWRLVNHGNQKRSLTAVAISSLNGHASPRKLGDLNGVSAEQTVGWASELVSCSEESRPVVQFMLGQVLVVGSAHAAYDVSQRLPLGVIAVSLDGFVAHAGGLVETPGASAASSIMAAEEAWRDVMSELASLRDSQRECEAEIAERQRTLEAGQEAIRRLNLRDNKVAQAVEAQGQRINELQRLLDRSRQQLEFSQRQQADDAARIAKLEARIAQAERKLEADEAVLGQLEEEYHRAQMALEALPVHELERERASLKEALTAARSVAAGRQAVVDSRRAARHQVDALLARRRERRAELARQAEATALEEAQNRLASCQQEVAALAAKIAPLQAEMAESEAHLARLEDEAEKLQAQAHELENDHMSAQVRLNQHESRLEGLQERIRNDLGLIAFAHEDEQAGQHALPLAEVISFLPQVTEVPEGSEEEVQRLRNQLRRLGSINPEAPAEYEETRRRHDFLAGQVEDLQRTDQQLRGVIADLDRRTSQAFAETVQQVDEIFGRMFTRLFGGGSATLVLTDPDDPTQTGVDIIARLPSRRQQSLALLSGGERSLTAAALIFALLKVAPPPFCLLDEVDAMLDEANVARFREALDELSETTQFIVITHNRGTVQVARAVYGISMGSDSASQVLSIRPEEYVMGET